MGYLNQEEREKAIKQNQEKFQVVLTECRIPKDIHDLLVCPNTLKFLKEMFKVVLDDGEEYLGHDVAREPMRIYKERIYGNKVTENEKKDFLRAFDKAVKMGIFKKLPKILSIQFDKKENYSMEDQIKFVQDVLSWDEFVKQVKLLISWDEGLGIEIKNTILQIEEVIDWHAIVYIKKDDKKKYYVLPGFSSKDEFNENKKELAIDFNNFVFSKINKIQDWYFQWVRPYQNDRMEWQSTKVWRFPINEPVVVDKLPEVSFDKVGDIITLDNGLKVYKINIWKKCWYAILWKEKESKNKAVFDKVKLIDKRYSGAGPDYKGYFVNKLSLPPESWFFYQGTLEPNEKSWSNNPKTWIVRWWDEWSFSKIPAITSILWKVLFSHDKKNVMYFWLDSYLYLIQSWDTPLSRKIDNIWEKLWILSDDFGKFWIQGLTHNHMQVWENHYDIFLSAQRYFLIIENNAVVHYIDSWVNKVNDIKDIQKTWSWVEVLVSWEVHLEYWKDHWKTHQRTTLTGDKILGKEIIYCPSKENCEYTVDLSKKMYFLYYEDDEDDPEVDDDGEIIRKRFVKDPTWLNKKPFNTAKEIS